MRGKFAVIVLALSCIALAACGGSRLGQNHGNLPPASAAATGTPGKPECPRLVNYTDAQLDAIQASLNKLPPDDALRSAMQDYEDMRDDTRVCQAVAKGE